MKPFPTLPKALGRENMDSWFDLDPRVKPEDDGGKRGGGGQFPFFTSPLRGEVAERSDAGEGEKGTAGFALPGPLIYERVTNLKIP